MPGPLDWQVAPHPTVPEYFALQRHPHAEKPPEYLANRIGSKPPVEAFLTSEQAQRVADFLRDRRNTTWSEADLEAAEAE